MVGTFLHAPFAILPEVLSIWFLKNQPVVLWILLFISVIYYFLQCIPFWVWCLAHYYKKHGWGSIHTRCRTVVVKELRKRIFKDLTCIGNILLFKYFGGKTQQNVNNKCWVHKLMLYSVNFCMKNSISVTSPIKRFRSLTVIKSLMVKLPRGGRLAQLVRTRHS